MGFIERLKKASRPPPRGLPVLELLAKVGYLIPQGDEGLFPSEGDRRLR